MLWIAAVLLLLLVTIVLAIAAGRSRGDDVSDVSARSEFREGRDSAEQSYFAAQLYEVCVELRQGEERVRDAVGAAERFLREHPEAGSGKIEEEIRMRMIEVKDALVAAVKKLSETKKKFESVRRRALEADEGRAVARAEKRQMESSIGSRLDDAGRLIGLFAELEKKAAAKSSQGKNAEKTEPPAKHSEPEKEKPAEKKAAAGNEEVKYFWHKHKLHTLLKKGDAWTAEKLLEPGLSVRSVLMRVNREEARRIPVKNGIVKVTATIPSTTGIGDDQEVMVFAAKVENRSGDLDFTVTEDLRKDYKITWEKLILSDGREIYCSFVNGKTLIDPAGAQIKIQDAPAGLRVDYTLMDADEKIPNIATYLVIFKSADGKEAGKCALNMRNDKNIWGAIKLPLPETQKAVKARREFEAFHKMNCKNWESKCRQNKLQLKGRGTYRFFWRDAFYLNNFTFREIKENLEVLKESQAAELFAKLIPEGGENERYVDSRSLERREREILTGKLKTATAAYLYGMRRDKNGRKLIKVIKDIRYQFRRSGYYRPPQQTKRPITKNESSPVFKSRKNRFYRSRR